MAKAPLEIRSLARKYTHKALNTLVSIMVEPKAPAAARIMAANSLLDRGWGKAAQLVAHNGEITQLVEVKLSVVQAQQPLTIEHDETLIAVVGAPVPPSKALPQALPEDSEPTDS